MASTTNVNLKGFDDLLESALKKVDSRFNCEKLTQEEKQKLEIAALEKLPEDYDYEVGECYGTESKFKLKVTTDNFSSDNLEGWLAEFQALNSVTLKVKAKKKETKGYSTQHYYRCQHDTRRWSPSKDPQRKLKINPAARVKNTNCPFQMAVKINGEHNCTIDIDWEHNHSVCTLESSNFKELSAESIEEVKKLYDLGETPSTARQIFLKKFRENCSNDLDFHVKKADRSMVPRRRDFCYIYDLYGKERFGGKNSEMLEKLSAKLDEYQKANPDSSVDYQLYGGDNTPLVIAIVTPLMKRIHKYVPQSGELIFVDATSNTEEHNLKVFLLCTANVAGALPCGLIITSDEKESTLKLGFSMLKKCLPEYAFYGNGPDHGPVVTLTDNCQEERSALRSLWPSTNILLCTFHILQQVWRWLLDKGHNICQTDRPAIMSLFKKAVLADTEDQFEQHYNDLYEELEPYENASLYFEELYSDKKAFAHCYRSHLPIRGNHTNNFVESQFLVLKDIILKRTKEYNVVALLERLLVDLVDHYKEKLLSIADGSFDGHFRRRFRGKSKTKKDGGQGFVIPTEDERLRFAETVKKYPNDIFEVESLSKENIRYSVDMSLGVCSCPRGKDGAPCKHQYLIWAANIATCMNFVPISNPDERRKLAEIALGRTLPLSYYTSLRGVSNAAIETNDAVEVEDLQQPADHADGIPMAPSDLTTNILDTTEVANIAITSVQNACSALTGMLQNCQDSKLSEAAMKFSKRLTKLSASSLMNGKLAAALFDFGQSELTKGKNGKKIKVQPNRKRKLGNGSRQAVAKGRPVAIHALEVPKKKAKQGHDLACSVRENRNCSKKSGSHVMRSKTRHVSK